MQTNSENKRTANVVVAAKLNQPPGPDGFPDAISWEAAKPVVFSSDWNGLNADPQRQTEVRLLWAGEFLYIQFRCRYREIYVYPGGRSRRDQLWLRDVAEVFIRPAAEDSRHYKEFEISPNGDWIDLDISPGRTDPLCCNLTSKVVMDSKASVWTAHLALPVTCLARGFDPALVWRVNFFRVEGPEPNRFYSAWRPTHTPKPDFHVPAAFGELHLAG